MTGLRFCMITTFYPPHNFGGDGIGVQRLSEALARRGNHVTVIHEADAYNALSGGRDPQPQTPSDGMRVISLRSRLRVLSPLLTQQTGRPIVNGAEIRRIVEEGDFDVVQFNNVSLVGGPGVLSLGRDAVRLYEAHEHWLVCPSHVLWRHNRELCTGRQCLRCVLTYRRPPQLWRYTGYLEPQLHNVDAFIAKSEFSRRKHQEFGFPRDMAVIPYFLPDIRPEEAAAPEQPPHERPFFLFVGRLEKIKGLDDVIPLFRDYRDADLLIAGDGEYASALKRLATGIDGVKFLGRVPLDELRRYYRHAVASIVPSVCFETFGIILIEAFRQGTPVIARRIGPFPEIVDRSGGGELFSNANELLEAMRRLQGDAAYRDRLARNAQDGFSQNWSESAVLPRYLNLVRRVAQEKGHSRISRALTAENVA